MTRHAYPIGALAGDYARALAGLALTVPPLLLVPLNRYFGAILAIIAALFLIFAWRTLMRQLATIEVSEAAIARNGLFPVRLEWSALDELKLAYYATRHDGVGGWMQLALRGGRRRLDLDSRIDGFAVIAARAAQAARQRALPISRTTLTNLAALGISPAPLAAEA